MEGFFQVAIILDRLVEVRHGPLEYVFDNSFDNNVLLSGKLGMVEISDSLQNNVFLQFFLLVVLLWIDSYLSVNRLELPLSEFGLAPKTVVQFATCFAFLSFSVSSWH
jgi:hypothetical protein